MTNDANVFNLIEEVKKLVELRREFEALFLNSRSKLYEVISGAIRLVGTCDRDRLAKFTGDDFKVTKKTDAALIAIKLIFPHGDRDQQQQCSVYAAVVRHAVEKGVSPDEFPTYAANFPGGMEAMRTGSTRNTGSDGNTEDSANAKRAKEFLSGNTQGIELDREFFLKPLPSGNEIVILMRPIANGNYQMVFATAEAKAVRITLDTLGAHRAEPASDDKSVLFADLMPEAPDELEEAVGKALSAKRKAA